MHAKTFARSETERSSRQSTAEADVERILGIVPSVVSVVDAGVEVGWPPEATVPRPVMVGSPIAPSGVVAAPELVLGAGVTCAEAPQRVIVTMAKPMRIPEARNRASRRLR